MKTTEKQILDILNESRTQLNNQNYEAAIQGYLELEKLLKDDPVNVAIIKMELGWSYYYSHNYAKAITKFEEVLQNSHTDIQQQFDAMRLIGFSNEVLGNLKQARHYLERALKLDVPEKVKRYAYFELGKVLYTKGKLMEAEPYVQTADALFEEQESVYKFTIAFFLGFIKYFQKKYEEARHYFEYIVKRSDDSQTRATGFYGLAFLHYHDNDYQALIDLSEKILRLDNNFFDKETLGYFLCHAFYNQKRWSELNQFFQELEKNYPHGRYFKEYARFRQAIQNWQKEQEQNTEKSSESNS